VQTFLQRVVLGLRNTGGEAQSQILGISIQILKEEQTKEMHKLIFH